MVEYGVIFTMGLFGGAHCMGMCGGFALFAAHRGAAQMAMYLGGKTLTYVVLGLVAGWLGMSLMTLAGYQRVLSILVGLFLILAGLGALGVLPQSLFGAWTARIAEWLGTLTARYGRSGSFALGLINGLLPCGLVYAALGYAAGLADPVRAGVGMAAFGLGTAPALALVGFAGMRLSARWRTRLARTGAVLVILLGIWILVRPWLIAGAHGMHAP